MHASTAAWAQGSSVHLFFAMSCLPTLLSMKPAVCIWTLNARKSAIPKWGGKLPPNLKLPLRDGDVDRPDDPAYENSYFINATSQEQPGVVDRKKVKITDPLAIYSGCYIRASINIYPFNANGNRGIAAGLSNIQFWEDGEPLNGRVRAEDEFDALDAEDDEDFLD